jgi:poly(3-hydroxybutyrate) depolymerase
VKIPHRARYWAIGCAAAMFGGGAVDVWGQPREPSVLLDKAGPERPPGDPAELQGVTTRFAFEQTRYMRRRHGPGGTLYVPKAAVGALPLVLFLHGLNAEERVAPHLDGGPDDLRPLLDRLSANRLARPFALAAPTHARFATGTKAMWPEFDIAAFVAAVRVAAPALNVDTDNIVLVGYSGGGCNPTGGALANLGASAPIAHVRARVLIDTCLDVDTTPRLHMLAAQAPLLAYHQRNWAQPWDALRLATTGTPNLHIVEVVGLGANPHQQILPIAFEAAMYALLPSGR